MERETRFEIEGVWESGGRRKNSLLVFRDFWDGKREREERL